MLKPVMDTCPVIAAVQMLKGSREQPLLHLCSVFKEKAGVVSPWAGSRRAAVSW